MVNEPIRETCSHVAYFRESAVRETRFTPLRKADGVLVLSRVMQRLPFNGQMVDHLRYPVGLSRQGDGAIMLSD
jgi:hypothetical protein